MKFVYVSNDAPLNDRKSSRKKAKVKTKENKGHAAATANRSKAHCVKNRA